MYVLENSRIIFSEMKNRNPKFWWLYIYKERERERVICMSCIYIICMIYIMFFLHKNIEHFENRPYYNRLYHLDSFT